VSEGDIIVASEWVVVKNTSEDVKRIEEFAEKKLVSKEVDLETIMDAILGDEYDIWVDDSGRRHINVYDWFGKVIATEEI
jgi:uncharacterized membrane protein